MSILKSLTLGVSVLAITGCTSFRDGRIPDRSSETPRAETRVFYGNCVRPAEKMPESFLIETFGSAIISNTLGRIGKAIRAAGEEDAHPSTAFRNLEVEPGKIEPCVQIVRGEFDDSLAPNAKPKTDGLSFLTAAITKPGANKSTVLTQVQTNLDEAGISISRAPDFFFEAQLSSSANKSAISLVPSFYTYNAPIKPGRSASGTYAMLVAVSFHPPGKPANAKEAAGTSLALGALSPSETTHRIYDLPATGARSPHESPWFSTFASVPSKGSKTPKKQDAAADQPAPNVGAPAPANNSKNPPKPTDNLAPTNKATSVPMILSATVTETRKANQVLLFFADVFDGSKETLQTEIEQALIPSARDAAALTDYSTSQTQLADYYSKFAAAEAKHDALCKLPDTATSNDRLTKSSELYSAQSAANVAAMTAGLPRPYDPLVVVSGDKLDCS